MATRTSRATVMSGKDFEIREYPIVDPAPGTVLVRQELGGICGTDLHNWEFQRIDHDIILGHENVGVIETLGEGVEADYLGNPVKEGDRIALSPSGGSVSLPRKKHRICVAVSVNTSTSQTRRQICLLRPICHRKSLCSRSLLPVQHTVCHAAKSNSETRLSFKALVPSVCWHLIGQGSLVPED